MKFPHLPQGFLAITAMAILIFSSCSKTEDTMVNEAACEYYLAGLSYQCNGDTCEYTATLEHDATGAKSEITIDKATYDQYKGISEEQGANICWEGAAMQP